MFKYSLYKRPGRQSCKILRRQLADPTHPDNLGAGVVGGAARGLQHGAGGLEGGHAEVGHLDVVLVVQQQVLRLQVSVAGKEQRLV